MRGTLLFAFISCYLQFGVDSHSWMSCPRPLDTSPDRGGDTNGPCESSYHPAVNKVKAGDRVKVGWTSNNHGGGFVRLSLVPESQKNNRDAYKKNVLKIVCYGHDQRPGEFSHGDCKHPCNTRPGCQYQSDKYDTERYDTTITIPHNLADGNYFLQFKSALGNEQNLYYSCAKLAVTGGNPSLSCASSGGPPIYECKKAYGLPLSSIADGTKRGDFCYHSDKIGDVDDRIREVPINVDCDPRITCSLSISSGCINQAGMKNIKNAWDPKQPNCGTITPPPPPTCSDKVQNQGEEDVDCGGLNCAACPPPKPGSSTGYEEYVKHKKINDWGTGFLADVEIKVKKNMAGKWRLTVFYDNPVEIVDHWSATLVSVNEFKTIFVFQGPDWNSNLRKGRVVSIGYKGKYLRTKASVKTLMFECYQCSVTSTFSLFAPATAGGCKELECDSGYVCEEVKVSPCKRWPCSEAHCIRE